MANKVKTSIITASYNSEKFFDEYLEGIYCQKQKPDMVAFVSDCSTDGLMDKIKSLSNTFYEGDQVWNSRGIKFVFSSTNVNSGPATARNKAIQLVNRYEASTQLILTYDADDRLYEDKISSSVDKYIKYPGIGIVYSDYITKNENTGISTREYKEPFNLSNLMQRCFISNNCMYPLKLIQHIGGYNESKDCISTEDYNLHLKMCSLTPAYHIPESLYMYRVHSSNLTVATPKDILVQRLQGCFNNFNEWRTKQNA